MLHPLDDIRRLLSHTIDGSHDVSSRQQWHHAGIHNTEVAHAVHLELSIHHTTFLSGAHLAATRGVVQRTDAVPDPALDISIRRDIGTGQQLDGAQTGDGICSPHATRECQGFLHHGKVERVRKVGRRGVGHVKRAVGRRLDGATRVRVLQAQHERARVPDDLEHGRVVAGEAVVEDGLLLLVARDHLGGGVQGQVLRAVLAGGLRGDRGRGVGVGRQGQEEQEVTRGRRVRARPVLLVLRQRLGGEGLVARQQARGDLFGGDGGHGGEEDVVLEVLAHGRQVDDSLDADFLVEGARADARDLQDSGRVDGAGGHDGLLVDGDGRPGALGRGSVLDARHGGGAVAARGDEPGDLLAREEVQVRTTLGGGVVGLLGGATGDEGGVDVVGAEVAADGLAGGLVLLDGDAELVGGVDDAFCGRGFQG